MEDYQARRLAESVDGLSARLSSGKMVNQLDELNHNARQLSKSINDNNQEIDKYIESNESLAIEQQLNRATEQFISIKISYKSKVLTAKETGEMLLMSYRSLQACYGRSSQHVKQKYNEALKSLLNKYQEFDKVLLAEEKKEEEFKF